jgi:NitT/TauT family transport system ATP-binding protein
VIDPTVLLMDEPFSALDVLTAETLRTDFIDLWVARKLPMQAVLIVTHNIEEAVSVCDRILILSGRPARITAEIPVTLQHPRNRLEPAFREIVDQIYSILTSRLAESIAQDRAVAGSGAQALPDATPHAIGALIDTL